MNRLYILPETRISLGNEISKMLSLSLIAFKNLRFVSRLKATKR